MAIKVGCSLVFRRKTLFVAAANYPADVIQKGGVEYINPAPVRYHHAGSELSGPIKAGKEVPIGVQKNYPPGCHIDNGEMVGAGVVVARAASAGEVSAGRAARPVSRKRGLQDG